MGIRPKEVPRRPWTFAEVRHQGTALRRLILFFCFNLAGLGLNTVIVSLLAGHLEPLVAKGVGTVVAFGWNYWSSCQVVFTTR